MTLKRLLVEIWTLIMAREDSKGSEEHYVGKLNHSRESPITMK